MNSLAAAKAVGTSMALFLLTSPSPAAAASNVSLSYHPTLNTQINNLTSALTSQGTYGFIFNTSTTPPEIPYSTYNWCNMPHARPSEYPSPPKGYNLVYVELIHRHHKRTPYESNSFPIESSYPWDCSSEGERLFYYADSTSSPSLSAAKTYQSIYTSSINPFQPSGFQGTCQLPQITSEGLQDSRQHGEDLYSVYGDLLGFLPPREEEKLWREQVRFRVTNNQITSQVAGALVGGMYPSTQEEGGKPVSLMVQRSGLDGLEPSYSCPEGEDAYSAVQSSDDNERWADHLERSKELYATLDAISGVEEDDEEWHKSWDHYFDNLSARQCHGKALPCSASDPSSCVTQEMANEVYRLGQWEYSHIYRDAGKQTLKGASGTMGVWIAELAGHFRDVMEGNLEGVKWFHNVAHDGSVSRVLGILQVDVMVWPGMGSEVIFEVYRRQEEEGPEGKGEGEKSGYYVRVLFGGQTLKSSNPSLGLMEMVPVETLLAYFDGLVGEGAGLVKGTCGV